MKKKLLAMLLAAVLAISLLPGAAFAADTSGSCGTNVTWSYSGSALTIQGTGLMNNYDNDSERTPWYNLREEIDTVVIGNGVTTIGGFAFEGCGSLTYVTIPDSVTIIKASAFEGCSNLTYVTIPDSVTIIEARAFYGCDSLTDVYYGGSESQWNKISIGEYNGPLTRANIHTEESEEPEEPTVPVFTDVKPDDYWYEPVLWAVENDITNGFPDGTFLPDSRCTRAQIVTFLWRAYGEPEPTSNENPFTDVPEVEYYTKAVLWAVENGITDGFPDGTFLPGNPCTRAQAVTFLWRAADKPTASGGSSFDDVPEGEWYTDAVAWAVENDITDGTGNNRFSPNGFCTRAQIVTFLYRELGPKG